MTDHYYRVNGTALVPAYARHVQLTEGIAGKRADLFDVAFRHGAYVATRHWNRARLMRLDTVLPYGTTGEVTAAHHNLIGILTTGLPTLTRNDPVHGDMRCQVLVSDPVEQPEGPQRVQWRWPVWQIRGYWETAAGSTEVDTGFGTTGTIGPFTPGGNMETEPVFTITCQTAGVDPTITDPANGDQIKVAGSFSASDVIVVDVPERTVTLNGVRAKNLLRINRGFWMALAAGVSHSLDFTATSGTWDVTTEWRDRIR